MEYENKEERMEESAMGEVNFIMKDTPAQESDTLGADARKKQTAPKSETPKEETPIQEESKQKDSVRWVSVTDDPDILEPDMPETAAEDLGLTRPLNPYTDLQNYRNNGMNGAGGTYSRPASSDKPGTYKSNMDYGRAKASAQDAPKRSSAYATPKKETKPKEQKPRRNLFWPIAAIVLGVLFIGTSVFAVSSYGKLYNLQKSEKAEKELIQSDGDIAETQPEEKHFFDAGSEGIDAVSVTEACMPSIVSITNIGVQEVQGWFIGTFEQPFEAAGSGVIIGENEDELLIVTNNHVIENSTELTVTFIDEASVSAQLKGTDSEHDLAVISVKIEDLEDETKAQIKIATIGDSNSLKVGESVISIGNALGYGPSVTRGIISALHRHLEDLGLTEELIQTDAAINPGSSGGALLNSKGELIGINVAKSASDYVEAIGYAIPISDVRAILDDLMTRETKEQVPEEEQGYLGVYYQEVTPEYSQMYNVPAGIYVTELVTGYGAEKAGIQTGDIITKISGTSVMSESDLSGALSYFHAGDMVTLQIQRMGSDGEYEEHIIEVQLSEKPEE